MCLTLFLFRELQHVPQLHTGMGREHGERGREGSAAGAGLRGRGRNRERDREHSRGRVKGKGKEQG